MLVLEVGCVVISGVAIVERRAYCLAVRADSASLKRAASHPDAEDEPGAVAHSRQVRVLRD